jgi:hypothetical protein
MRKTLPIDQSNTYAQHRPPRLFSLLIYKQQQQQQATNLTSCKLLTLYPETSKGGTQQQPQRITIILRTLRTQTQQQKTNLGDNEKRKQNFRLVKSEKNKTTWEHTQ